MKDRVSSRLKTRKNYFDRGITVCEEWNDYVKFKVWALNNGFKKELQLDRIDNNKGYYPANCRWTTRKINNHNKTNTIMVSFNGKKEPLTMVCEKLGFNRLQILNIRHRIARGWDIHKAINTPIVDKFSKKKRKDYRVIDTATGYIYMPNQKTFI